MTVDSPTRAWTPRIAVQLTVLAAMIAASTALTVVALSGVTATRGLFDVPQVTSRK